MPTVTGYATQPRHGRMAGLPAAGLLVAALALVGAVELGCRSRAWEDASPLAQYSANPNRVAPWWITQVPAEPGVAWYGVGQAPFHDPASMVQAPLVAEARARQQLADRVRPVLRDAAEALLAPRPRRRWRTALPAVVETSGYDPDRNGNSEDNGDDNVNGNSDGSRDRDEEREEREQQAQAIADHVSREIARHAVVVDAWQDRESRTVHALARGLDSHVLFLLLREARRCLLDADDEEDDDEEEEDGPDGGRRNSRARLAMLDRLAATRARVLLVSQQRAPSARAWMPRGQLWFDPLAWPSRDEPGPMRSGLLAGAEIYTARNELALEQAEEAARLRLAIRVALVVQEALNRLLDRETDSTTDPRRWRGVGVTVDVAALVGLEAAARAQVRSLALDPPGPMPDLSVPRNVRRANRASRDDTEPDPLWARMGLDDRLRGSAWYTPRMLRTRANRAMVGVPLFALAILTTRALHQRLPRTPLPDTADLVAALRRLIEEARRDVLREDRHEPPLYSPIDVPVPLPPVASPVAEPAERDDAPAHQAPPATDK